MSHPTELFLRTLSVAALVLAPVAANAQTQGRSLAPQTSTGIAAFVNGSVISNYDLDQRTALYLATSGVQPTRDNLPQIRSQVLRSLEDEMIELEEANKRRITASKPEVDKALQNIAADNKLTVPQILSTIGQAGVAPGTFVQQLSAQIIWQKLVTARYGTDILISDQDVDDVMNQLKQSANKPQYLLSEVYIGVDRVEDELRIRASAQQFAQQIMQGASFQTVASQFSQSPSAADGGDIGWFAQGQLADELDQALADLKPGQIAGPIRAEGGYYILLLRDRRDPGGASAADTRPAAPADAGGALPLERFLIPLPANPDAAIKERALTLASQVKGQVKSCGDLPNIASQLQGSVHQKLGTMDPKNLNPQLRDALAKTGPGEMLNPFFSPAGLELILRCDSALPEVRPFELPSPEQVRQQLFAQKLSLYSKSYLHDLRRSAIVQEVAN